jgi:hypothetical protein
LQIRRLKNACVKSCMASSASSGGVAWLIRSSRSRRYMSRLMELRRCHCLVHDDNDDVFVGCYGCCRLDFIRNDGTCVMILDSFVTSLATSTTTCSSSVGRDPYRSSSCM